MNKERFIMKDKNILKKVGLVIVLIIIVIVIILVAVNASTGKKEKSTNVATVEKVAQSTQNSVTVALNATEGNKETKVTQLESGTMYSFETEEITPEIVVGDNYYGTQIADMNLNFDEYEGKTIEIEGLYFENTPYTFIGRYSTSNVCPDCPEGYSYFEYEWKGEDIELTDSTSWMKIVGTLRKGNDGVEYYYIDANNIEIMNESGIETVSN
jgi:hypothetical protein